MKLHILGAGNPDPNPQRYGSAFLLEIGGDRLMIDCGPATTFKLAHIGFKPTQIDWLFFTHHHFDHNADYPCFLLTRWDQSGLNATRLNVIGPNPTALITDRLIGEEGAFYHELTHCNRGVVTPGRREHAITEVARHYAGRIILADELMSIDI